jgi:hypothetical protein
VLATPGVALEATGGLARLRRITTASRLSMLVAMLGAIGAMGLVFVELGAPHGLYGVTQYDDGVYYGGALELVAGHLPYRDFVFVQPPGIAVLMAPIAWLVHDSRTGLAIARILTGVVTGANVLLVGVILRHRGVVATLIGVVALGIFPPAYTADHTLLLEPYLVFFCLLGATLAFRQGAIARNTRLVLGGLALGVATSVKLWGALIVLAALICFLGYSWRAALRLAAGAVLGFVLVCGPFFVLAPSSFVRQVVTDQLTRTVAAATPISERLAAISGVAYLSKRIGLGAHSAATLTTTLVLGVIVLMLVFVPALLRRAQPVERFIALGLCAALVALFTPKQFFDHYAYFSGAFLALALGLACANGIELARTIAPHVRLTGRALQRVIGAVVLVALLLGAAGVLDSEIVNDHNGISRAGDPGPRLAAAIPHGSCAMSDAAILLVLANRFSTTTKDCPVILDPTGTWLDYDPAHPELANGVRDPKLVALWQHALARADYVELSRPMPFRIPWTPALNADFASSFALVPHSQTLCYRRIAARTSPA